MRYEDTFAFEWDFVLQAMPELEESAVALNALRRRRGVRSAEDLLRASDAGLRAYDDIDSTEICGRAGGRVFRGKSAIHIARVHAGRRRNFKDQHFWARGYFASTVGRDEQTIREYIRNQEAEDRRFDQLHVM